ncbi:MAG: PAS domain S-box protein [Deltaproteobacteria bacterium]|nr:PAS domain S-box protein [Deltaproteobacteria bacterium]
MQRQQSGSRGGLNSSTLKSQTLAERYEYLNRYANDSIFIIEHNGRIVEANEHAVFSYGYALDELLDMNIREIRASETLNLLNAEMERILAGEGMIFETVHRRKNGTTFPVEVSSRGVSLGGENYFLSIIRDITDRKLAEEKIIRLNRMYAFISEINHAIVRVRSREELFEEICRIAAEYGKFHMAWIGLVDNEQRSVKPFCQTDETFALREIPVAEDGEQAGLSPFGRTVRECRCVVCNDVQSDRTLSPWRDELTRISCRSLAMVPFQCQGHIVGILNVYTQEKDFFDEKEVRLLEEIGMDVSFALEKMENDAQCERAEEELRAADARYRVLFESAPVGVNIIDPETRAPLQFNDITCRQLGYTREEFSRLKVFDWEISCSQADLYMADVLRRGQGTYETQHRTKNGETRQVIITARVIELGGRPVFYCIVQDMTERKRLESQLIQSQKMEAIGNLASGIAHDFNNLLMGIQGRSSLLLLDMEDTHPHYRKLKSIEEYVQSGKELTRHLLAFVTGGKPEVKTTNMNELVEKVSLMFGQTRKEITVHRKYTADLFMVKVDRGQMEQVLLNLFVNAWQAMPGGGELYLATENVILDHVYVKPFSIEPGNFVKISVTDTGIGMDGKTKERIFEPFFTTKETGMGTGLGLTTVYGIVKGHGGIVNVYSEKDVGTVFNVYLPISGEKQLVEEKNMKDKILKGKEVILLVDDEEMIIEVTKEILEVLGYRVLVASGGEEAVNIYRERNGEIDLVILDMMMPAMGGKEAFEILKEIRPDIKVILASGYNIDGRPAKMLAQGCSAFIQKPFSIEGLSQKIRDVLEGK